MRLATANRLGTARQQSHGNAHRTDFCRFNGSFRGSIRCMSVTWLHADAERTSFGLSAIATLNKDCYSKNATTQYGICTGNHRAIGSEGRQTAYHVLIIRANGHSKRNKMYVLR